MRSLRTKSKPSAGPAAEVDSLRIFKGELREVLEDAEGIGVLLVQRFAAVAKGTRKGARSAPSASLRVLDMGDAYEVRMNLPEADPRGFDVQIVGQWLELRLRGGSLWSRARGRHRLSPGDSPPEFAAVRFDSPVSGDEAEISADAVGIRIVVPKRSAASPASRTA